MRTSLRLPYKESEIFFVFIGMNKDEFLFITQAQQEVCQ
jgi:hypothetical protein